MIDEQTFSAILEDVASGEPAYKAAQGQGISMGKFWRTLEVPERAEKYARAKALGMDRMADDILSIADDGNLSPDDRRTRIDPRKWLLSKLAPKKYGDKLELAGDSASPLTLVISKSDAKL